MKLIVLAAGAGSRLQSPNSKGRPKPIQIFQDKSLIEWSLEAWRPLFRAEQLRASDVVIAIQEQHAHDHGTDEFLRQCLGDDVRLVILDKMENGPALTLKRIFEKLDTNQFFDIEEPVFISDCDHFIKGNAFSEYISGLLKGQITRRDIVLFERRNRESTLNASFLVRQGEKAFIHEKPSLQLAKEIDTRNCLVGVYGFGSAGMLSSALDKIDEHPNQSEVFVSKVVNVCLDTEGTNLVTDYIEQFYNLGDPDGQRIAQEGIPSSHSILESNTFLIDIDGVLVKHESGPNLKNREYEPVPKLLENWETSDFTAFRRSGDKFIFVSARSESQRSKLESLIASMGFTNYDLVLGATSGIRILINDIKPNIIAQPTSLAINVERDFGGLREFLLEKSLDGNPFTLFQQKGESGAFVSHLQNKKELRLRKTIFRDSTCLLEYQRAWFSAVGEFFPTYVPQVHGSYSDSTGFSYLDLELMDSFKTLDLQTLDAHKQIELKHVLSCLYGKFETKSIVEPSKQIESIWRRKVLPGYVKALDLLGENVKSDYMSVKHNSTPIPNCMRLLEVILRKIEDTNLRSGSLESREFRQTLIHGDLTLGNIGKSKESIVLLDPIGSRVHPDFKFQGRLGRSLVEFDLARLILSVNCRYEEWSSNVILSNGELTSSFSLELDQILEVPSRIWPDDWLQLNESDFGLVFLSTLGRILPYKCVGKKNEAYFIIWMMGQLCSKFARAR